MREADAETIPLADVDPTDHPTRPRSRELQDRSSPFPRRAPSRLASWLAPALIVILSSAHGAAIWFGLGGLAGLTNGWPLWRHDHPLYYHSALVTRAFLKDSWTTAGYDPFFMSGYAKSVVFPSSSTLPELVVAFFGGEHPELAYKIYVLVAAAAVPWLIALACAIWRVPAGGSAVTVFLALVYIWTDFPITYAAVGMVPYFLGIPLALCATGVFARFLAQGGASNWMLAALLTSLAFLVHLTTAMEIVPAAAMVYLARASRRGAFLNGSILIALIAAPFIEWVPLTETQLWTIVVAYAALVVVLMQVWDRSARRRAMARGQGQPTGEPALGRKLTPLGHLTLWAIPVVVLAVNSFWWLPGIWLAKTKGPSDFTFKHDEGVLLRLGQIFSTEAPIECALIAAGLPGMFMLLRRDRILGWACLGFAAAAFAWGYVAGLSRSLDFLQPGRHTYAFYLALAVSAGIMLQELFKRLRGGPHALDRWVMIGAIVIGVRIIGYPGGFSTFASMHGWFTSSILSSRPTQRAQWIVDCVTRHLKPGQRLLYEEGGFAVEIKDERGAVIERLSDPFQGGRLSGILPERTGVQLIGGPYLHASLQTNFTQFGEGRLCGKKNWTKQDFIRYAKLYGPSAILCWTPHARQFCAENTDVVEILETKTFKENEIDRMSVTLIFARLKGFEGDFLEGSGRVEAASGVLRLYDLTPGLDGTVVLRYHSVPYLRARPEVAIEQEFREDDPVPFIRLRLPPGTSNVELKLHLPIGR
jgi:hypothetical protein